MTRANITFLTVLCLNGILTLVQSHLSEEDKADIVNTHNRLRKDFAKGANGVVVSDMKKLVWSSQLELIAQETLELQCARTILNFNRRYTSNEEIHSTGSFTGDISSWYSNITRHFLPQYGACIPYRSCQSAYRMLNARHQHIGCAYKTDCEQSNTFLCLYDDQSEFPFYKTGPVCTSCDGEAAFCDDGLCVACDNSRGTCDCRKTCERDQVGLGTLNTSNCTCTCQYGLGPNCDEPCVNRQMYADDYDICAELTEDMCDMPEMDLMLKDFCPAVCHCKQFPVN